MREMELEFEAASKTWGREEVQEGLMRKGKKVEEKKERERSQRK